MLRTVFRMPWTTMSRPSTTRLRERTRPPRARIRGWTSVRTPSGSELLALVRKEPVGLVCLAL